MNSDSVGAGTTLWQMTSIFFGMRPDVALVLRNRVPVGVVLIKCPDVSNYGKIVERSLAGVKDPFVIGQLYDYMMLLRNNFGVQSVFGIVSNYISTRFAWLSDESDPETNADVIARQVPEYASISDTMGLFKQNARYESYLQLPNVIFPTFAGSLHCLWFFS